MSMEMSMEMSVELSLEMSFENKSAVVPAYNIMTVNNVSVDWHLMNKEVRTNIITDLCQEQETLNIKEKPVTVTKQHNATFTNNGHSVKQKTHKTCQHH